MLVLATIFWAKSGVIATSADIARPGVGFSSAVVTAGSYLPTQMLEPIW
jgi:hypothetical protein